MVKILISCSTKFWITRWCDRLLLSKHLKYHPWFYLISSIKVDPLHPLWQHLVSKLVSRFCLINLFRDKSPPLSWKIFILSLASDAIQLKQKYQSSRRKKNPWSGEYFNVSTADKVTEIKRKTQEIYRI